MTERPIIFSAPMVRAILDGRKKQTRRLTVEPVPDMPPNTIHPSNVGRAFTHNAPYLDAYCAEIKTPDNPRGMGTKWCWWTADDRCGQGFKATRWQPGDRLWVREAWKYYDWTEDGQPWIGYRADNTSLLRNPPEDWAARVENNWITLSDPANLAIDGRAHDLKWRPSIHMPRWASRITLAVTAVRVERLQDISEADAVAEGAFKGKASGRVFESMTSMRMFGPQWGNARDWFSDTWDAIHGPDAWAENPWVSVTTFERVET